MVNITMLVTSSLDHDPRVQKEALSAHEAGHTVTVICRTYEGLTLPFKVITLNITRKNHRLLKFFERIWTNIQLIVATLSEKPDIVHANDFDTLPAGFIASRLSHAKLVYDAHEFWSEAGRDVGAIGAKIAFKVERFLSQRATSVITVSPVMANIMEAEFNCKPPLVILNSPPYKNTENCEVGDWLKQFQGRKTILYQGRYVANRGLPEAILAAKYLPEFAILVFRGFGPLENHLREMVTELQLTEKVVFLPPVPMFDMVESAVGADLGLALYLPVNKNNLAASPNKLYEYIMASVPIVGSDVPNIRNTLLELGVGSVFEPGDPQDLARIINDLLSNPDKLSKMKQNCREYASEVSWETQSRKLVAEYERITN